jgi:phage-related protein (TIGR01555 family)
MSKQSVKRAALAAQRQDAKLRSTVDKASATADNFVNFAHKMGVGADNALSAASYGFNPITRNRTQLEWIHRGSWLGGVAVDMVADDMTRAGVEFVCEMRPEQEEAITRAAVSMGIWDATNSAIKWGRLYGGAICVALIDGQDMRTPLRLNTVGPRQFKGLLTLDRWMVEPTLEDLVTDFGPHLGLPKYYRVQANAPALRGCVIHHSRVMFRPIGVELPYQQQLMENLWGISVIERLYDRMIAFDSATTGSAQLVYKSYLRTLSVKGLREVVAMGGKALEGLVSYAENMRRFQGMEGMSMIDAEDTLEIQGHSAFSGLSDTLVQFGQQLSGALRIPLVRLFGQSPAGLNSTGEADIRLYYDGINQEQMKVLHAGMTTVYRLIAISNGIALPSNFGIDFRSLWEMNDSEKATVAGQAATAVQGLVDGGIIGRKTALKELRQTSRRTGIFTNITSEMIAAADDEVQQPAEGLPPGVDPESGMPPGIDPQTGAPALTNKPDDGQLKVPSQPPR